MGKTHSKPLVARHGRGTAWARHAMCESAFLVSTISTFLDRILMHIATLRGTVAVSKIKLVCIQVRSQQSEKLGVSLLQ
jgi:hypothetical protein